MIIGIESTLENIKRYIDSTGRYETYILGQYSGPIDAFIYESQYNDQVFTQYQTSIRDIALETHRDVNEGILMINAINKTPREVEAILNTRLV